MVHSLKLLVEIMFTKCITCRPSGITIHTGPSGSNPTGTVVALRNNLRRMILLDPVGLVPADPPVVHVRVRWITERRKDPACTEK